MKTVDLRDLPDEASAALAATRQCFPLTLVAAYLHGSAVSSGLQPNSDVDVLVVVDRPTTHLQRQQLLAALMPISGHPDGDTGRRPLELFVFARHDLEPVAYPARSEFLYGEWLRDAFEAGAVPEPVADPEFTLILAQARLHARVLAGPAPAQLLPDIPFEDIRRAIGDALPTLLNSLQGDERNVLLTLARMWRTLTTGEFVSKDVAAEWVVPRLPPQLASTIAFAGRAYRGDVRDDWSDRAQDARDAARVLSREVVALL